MILASALEYCFSVIAYDTQAVPPKTSGGSTTVMVTIDVFTRQVREFAIPEEKMEALVQVPLDQ